MKRWLSRMVARRVRRAPLTPAELAALRPERILVVRQHNQMGDMVCATPVFRALRETFPQARIGLITSPVNREVVRHNPHLDEILNFEQRLWRHPLQLLKFWRQLRAFKPDLAFVLASVSFSVTSAGLALASGAPYVVGADSRPFGHDISSEAFSLEMPSNPELDRHSVLHSLAPLQAIGITTGDLSTVMVPDSGQQRAARAVMKELGLEPGFWALHPGAGKKQNLWPVAGFAELAAKAAAAGRQVLVLHGPADGPVLQELLPLLGEKVPGQVKVAPGCSVGVAAALLQQADRFLCNDTGIMHVAGALAVPTLALFGPTDPQLWKPNTDQVVALCSHRQTPDQRGPEFGWMENISPLEAWTAWQGLPGRRE